MIELLHKARNGDQNAIEELLQRNRERLRNALHAQLGDELRRKVHTSDILQSTYIDIVSSVKDFRGSTEEDFTGWVVRVLENNVRDAARYFTAGKRDRSLETSVEDVTEVHAPDSLPSPSAEVAWSDELVLIGRALRALPDEYFRIICLHMKPEQDHETTARLLGKSVGASRVLLARARAALLLEIQKLRRRA